MGDELDQIGRDSENAGQPFQAQQAAAQQGGCARDADTRLAALNNLANRETELNLRQQYLFDAAYWAGEHNRWAAELARNQRIAAEAAKVHELDQRRAGIEARLQRESGGVARLEGSLNGHFATGTIREEAPRRQYAASGRSAAPRRGPIDLRALARRAEQRERAATQVV